MTLSTNTNTPKAPLGRLERVRLRDYWLREDTGFTTWLAQQENIRLLGDAIGIELEVEAQEKAVGPFSADLLCKDTATDAWVVIENQIERTDHKHLGQILTYTAGLGATTIIWIAKRFTDEHRAALDWLNSVTREGIDFFGLEIELWRIGDSAAAPKFNVVAKPNDWQKRIAGSGATGALSPARQMQLDFWTAFHEHLLEHSKIVKPGKPYAQAWMNIGMGGHGFVLNAYAALWDSKAGQYSNGELRVDVVINGPNAEDYFAMLLEKQEYITGQIKDSVAWIAPKDSRVRRISVRRSVDLGVRESWDEYFAWLTERLERLHGLFVPLAREVESELRALPGISSETENPLTDR